MGPLLVVSCYLYSQNTSKSCIEPRNFKFLLARGEAVANLSEAFETWSQAAEREVTDRLAKHDASSKCWGSIQTTRVNVVSTYKNKYGGISVSARIFYWFRSRINEFADALTAWSIASIGHARGAAANRISNLLRATLSSGRTKSPVRYFFKDRKDEHSVAFKPWDKFLKSVCNRLQGCLSSFSAPPLSLAQCLSSEWKSKASEAAMLARAADHDAACVSRAKWKEWIIKAGECGASTAHKYMKSPIFHESTSASRSRPSLLNEQVVSWTGLWVPFTEGLGLPIDGAFGPIQKLPALLPDAFRAAALTFPGGTSCTGGLHPRHSPSRAYGHSATCSCSVKRWGRCPRKSSCF